MNTKIILSVLILVLNQSGVRAQTYSIDWFTIDGGGGTSTGGAYSISGSIGQPDAGPTMTGGNYSLTGGFWSLVAAVPTPGAPTLTIALTSTNTIIVSWPSSSTEFGLQQNSDLSTSNWVAAGESISDNNTNRFIIVNPSVGKRFYRLIRN